MDNQFFPALMGIFKSMGGASTPPSVSPVSKATTGSILGTLSSKLNFGASVPSKTTDNELLGMIYELMVKKQDNETLEYEQYVSKEEQYQSKTEQRHQEIVAALTGFQGRDIPKLDTPKSGKTKPTKIKNSKAPKVAKPKKERVATKRATATKTGKKTGVFSKSSGSSGLFNKPSGSSGLFSGGTGAAAVAVGVGLMGVAGSIGAAESGGNYNVTFGDRVQNGKIVNSRGYITTQEAFGKPLTEMTLEEVKLFGAMRNTKSMNSGAVGKYQFIPSTLFGRNTKDGFAPGLVQQMKLDMNAKFTATLQDQLYQVLHERDVKSLKSLGVPVTPGYEYMAHYIGPKGAAAVYYNRDKDMTVAQALVASGIPEPGKVNNPELYEIKTFNFERILENRLNNRHSVPPAQASAQGDKISADSSQNKQMKDSAAVTQNITNNNTTNVNSKSGQPNSKTEPEDDRNPYERKMKHG